MNSPEQKEADKDLVDRFIREKASRKYPAFAEIHAGTAISGEDEKQLPRPPPYRALEEVLDRAQSQLEPDFNVKQCSWEDVQRQLKQAEDEVEKYFAQAKGAKGILRKVWRKLGRASIVWEPGLEAIPDEMGLSVLKGGLALIFNFAKRSAENCVKILEAFEDIPDVLLMAQEKRRTFPSENPSNDRLRDALDNLYRKLFESIPKYIDILLRTTLKSPFKGEEIDNLQNEVKKAAERVKMIAESCVTDYIVKSHQVAKEIHENVRGVEVSVLKMSSDMETVGKINRDVEEMAAFFREWRERMREDALNSRDWLAQFLLEQLKVIRLSLPVEVSIHHSRSSSPQPASPQDLARLVNFLGVPTTQAVQDLQYVLRKRQAFDLVSQAQVQMLWASEQFKHWFFSKASAVLLVDANFDTTITGRLSPMSLFCAMMSVQLPDADHNIWLQFFCGQYTRSSSPVCGPHGMVRSLITQLLMQLHGRNMLTLVFLDPDAAYEDGGMPALDGLCRMLSQLVRTLPAAVTLFCVLDGISYFETEEAGRDLCYVVERLKEIACDEFLRPNFKLLMTSPARSKYVQGQVQYWQQLTLKRGQGVRPLSERTFWNDANKAMRH